MRGGTRCNKQVTRCGRSVLETGAQKYIVSSGEKLIRSGENVRVRWCVTGTITLSFTPKHKKNI